MMTADAGKKRHSRLEMNVALTQTKTNNSFETRK